MSALTDKLAWGQQHFNPGGFLMRKLQPYTVAFIMLAVWLVQPNANPVLAQKQAQPLAAASSLAAGEEANHDIQIYLLVGSNQSGERSGLPAMLDPVIKQLRSSMPYSNYHLGASFFNRVKNGGSLNVKGVAGSLFPVGTGPNTPAFYEFNLVGVKLDANVPSQRIVEINRFGFGLRMPVITTGTRTDDGKTTGYPVINYESTGIHTEVSIGEGIPTIIGTMTTGRADESFILVITIKPSSPR
jgi:hypothetical protein